MTLTFPGGTSQPNIICTRTVNGPLDCAHTTQVDFPNPVSNLKFLGTGDDDVGVTAKIDVYENNVLSATVDFVTDGSPFLPDLADLSGFANVTRIVIRSITDANGLGWDDFEFDVGPVPVESVTWGQIKSVYR